MSEGCSERGDQLAPYVDGELDAADADAFALHLAGCAACRAGLHDALQLVALEARAAGPRAARIPGPRLARERVRRWNRRQVLAIAATAAAVLGVIVVLVFGVFGGRGGGGAREPEAPIALETADVRSLEGRISYAAADRHRRYAVVRAGAPAAADAIALPTLAELDRRGDLHGVAAAYLLLGDPARARTYLERAPANPDVAADRALVLLVTGHPDEALIALDGVLEAAPRHPQARWNRALALRDLGLPRMAVAAFEAAAELGEPGWAEEAQARAKALAAETDERQARSAQLVAAGRHLSTAPGGISADLAHRIPGSARIYFYDAVRSATTADAVRGLAPLARTLDAVAGDQNLIGYVERTARADFIRRGPLAARYAKIVDRQRLDPAATRDFLAALRAAHQDDILLGALVLTSPDGVAVVPDQLPELRRLADATGEPWFRMLATVQEAMALVAQGDAQAAELKALPALAGCTTGRLDLLCAQLDIALGDAYLIALRLSDARRVLGDGIARARRGGEWLLERWFFPELVNLEVLGDDVSASTLPLVRAYLGELTRRDPSCATEVWSRQEIAMVLVNRPHIDAARAEIAQADAVKARCPDARSIVTSVFVKAQIARDDQVAEVRAEIAGLRAEPTTTPGWQALLDQTEGRMLITRDRAAGIALLDRAIAKSRALPAGDVEGHKARSYAYGRLTLDAGRASEWPRVWQLLQDEGGVAIERCGLGVSVENGSRVVVVRDATGAFAGAYDAAGQTPELDALHLIPDALRDRLRGCPEVDVLARPPIEGSPALLPPELAWSYRSAAAVRDPSPPRAPPLAHGARLVISNTEPPPELGLPHLLPWRSAQAPDVALEGAAATPSRALAALAEAGFVEIHAHGTVNATVSDASFLMMSPDPGGRYALTAAEIRKQPLHGRPIVILAACHAGATASYRHEPWGLPAAFIEAGARAVIASPDVIDDADAGALFDAVRAQIERGTSPAAALHDVRLGWLAAHPEAVWTRSLMVFR
jgi:tetratricopeptide (TPR) repeat protein